MLSVILIVISMICDVKSYKIPNLCIVMLLLLAVVNIISATGMDEAVKRAGAMLMVFITGYPFFCFRMVGAGDIKFLMTLTLYMPVEKVVYFLFLSFILSAVYAVTKMIAQKSTVKRVCYLVDYIREGKRKGRFGSYYKLGQEYKDVIPMALPVGVSFFLYLGGMY